MDCQEQNSGAAFTISVRPPADEQGREHQGAQQDSAPAAKPVEEDHRVEISFRRDNSMLPPIQITRPTASMCSERGVTITDFRDSVYPSSYCPSHFPDDEDAADKKSVLVGAGVATFSRRDTTNNEGHGVASTARSTESSMSSREAGDQEDVERNRKQSRLDKSPPAHDDKDSNNSSEDLGGDIQALLQEMNENKQTEIRSLQKKCSELEMSLEQKNLELESAREAATMLSQAGPAGAEAGAVLGLTMNQATQEQLFRDLASASAKRIEILENGIQTLKEENLRAKVEAEEVRLSTQEQLLELETMRLELADTRAELKLVSEEKERLLEEVQVVQRAPTPPAQSKKEQVKSSAATAAAVCDAEQRALNAEQKLKEVMNKAREHRTVFVKKLDQLEMQKQQLEKRIGAQEQTEMLVEDLQKRLEINYENVSEAKKMMAAGTSSRSRSATPRSGFAAGGGLSGRAAAGGTMAAGGGTPVTASAEGNVGAGSCVTASGAGHVNSRAKMMKFWPEDPLTPRSFQAILDQKESLRQRLDELHSAKRRMAEQQQLHQPTKAINEAATVDVEQSRSCTEDESPETTQHQLDANAKDGGSFSMRARKPITDGATASKVVASAKALGASGHKNLNPEQLREMLVPPRDPSFCVLTPGSGGLLGDAGHENLHGNALDGKTTSRIRAQDSRFYSEPPLGRGQGSSVGPPKSRTRRKPGLPQECFPKAVKIDSPLLSPPYPETSCHPPTLTSSPGAATTSSTPPLSARERHQQERDAANAPKKPPFVLGSAGAPFPSSPLCSPRGVYGNVVRQELVNVPPANILASSDYLW